MLQCCPEHPYKSRGCVFLALIYKCFITLFFQYFFFDLLYETLEHPVPDSRAYVTTLSHASVWLSEYFLFLICLPVLTSH